MSTLSRLLLVMKENRVYRPEDLAAEVNLPKEQITRTLEMFVRSGVVEVVGEGRYRRYKSKQRRLL